MGNFVNPLSTINTAVAEQAQQKPPLLTEIQQRMAQTGAIQQETALRAQQAAGVGQENTIRAREMAADAAVRDAIKNNTKTAPLTPPSSQLPPPPVDPATGKPTVTPAYQAAQASSAVTAPITDWDAVAHELNARGFGDRALTLAQTVGNVQKTNLDNTDKKVEVFNKQVASRRDAISGIVETMYPDGPDKPRSAEGVAKAAAMWDAQKESLLQLGMKPEVVNAPFDPDRVEAQYRALEGAEGRTKSIQDHLGIQKTRGEITEKGARTALYGAQTGEANQQAGLLAEQAKKAQFERELREKFMSGGPSAFNANVDAVISPTADKGKYKDINARVKSEAWAVFQATGSMEKAIEVVSKEAAALNASELELKTGPQKAYANAAAAQRGAASTLDPEVFADDVANYRVRLTDVLSRMPGMARQKILEAVRARNPNFQESNYDVAKKTEETFTSGSKGDLVRANNNALEHLGLLHQAGQALAQNNVQGMNQIANEVGAQLGSDAKTTYDYIAKKVGDETTKAFIPGGGGQGERAAAFDDFKSSLSPQQRESNIKASIHLMDSQQRNLKYQYDQGTYGRGAQPLYTERAMQTRDSLLGSVKMKAPDGSVSSVPPSDVEHYKALGATVVK